MYLSAISSHNLANIYLYRSSFYSIHIIVCKLPECWTQLFQSMSLSTPNPTMRFWRIKTQKCLCHCDIEHTPSVHITMQFVHCFWNKITCIHRVTQIFKKALSFTHLYHFFTWKYIFIYFGFRNISNMLLTQHPLPYLSLHRSDEQMIYVLVFHLVDHSTISVVWCKIVSFNGEKSPTVWH